MIFDEGIPFPLAPSDKPGPGRYGVMAKRMITAQKLQIFFLNVISSSEASVLMRVKC
jgi:hypothetical protein